MQINGVDNWGSVNVTFDVTDTDAINAAVDTAFNTAIPETNTADSLNDIVLDQLAPRLPGSGTITTGAMRGTDNAALASVVGALDAETATGAVSDAKVAMGYLKQLVTVLLDIHDTDLLLATSTTLAGKLQMATTTESLNQAASTYDLLTGTTQAVVLEKLNVKLPTGAVGGALTSISIQTDDATPGVIISSTNGAVANLTSEADLSWTGSLIINVGTKIQLTIAGGAHGSAYAVTIIVQSRAVVSGGYLAVSA
jgi:hypothetical protein